MNQAPNPNGPYGDPNAIQIPSAATCKISLFRDELQLSTASGFLTENSEAYFLITALHNLTGRDFFTRKCLSPNLATPNRISARVSVRQVDGRLLPFDLRGDLFGNGRPIFLYDWSEEGGDIAVIKLPKEVGSPEMATMNEADSEKWTTYVGLDVFALGFPSAIDVNGTPVWKKVSIASEPSQKVNGRNATLTDGLTYSGMSGGPVLISQSQGLTDEKVYVVSKGLALRIVGVYGGRFDTDKDRSGTLGFYWPIEIADKIIADERQRGDIDAE